MPIDSIYDFTDKALVELKSWLEPWFLTRRGPGAAPAVPPFFDSAIALGATHSLLGYWRLGDSSSPFLDSNPYLTGFPLPRGTGTNALTFHLSPGALPTDQDDGAVAFTTAGGYSGGSPVNDYLEGSTDIRFKITSDMSFAVWVNPTASGSTFTGGVGGTRGFNTNWLGYGLTVDWPSRVISWHRGDDGSNVTDLVGPALPAGAWTFVVVTYSHTTGSKLYLNGSLVASDPVVFTPVVPTSAFRLGATLDSSGHRVSFYGSLDEASMWGAVLAAADVALLYESGGAVTPSGFLSYVLATGAYTATAADDVILANGTFTVSLPTAVARGGKQYTVKNTGSGTVTVDPAGSETIDGSGTVSLTTLKAVTVVSNGTNWAAIGGY